MMTMLATCHRIRMKQSRKALSSDQRTKRGLVPSNFVGAPTHYRQPSKLLPQFRSAIHENRSVSRPNERDATDTGNCFGLSHACGANVVIAAKLESEVMRTNLVVSTMLCVVALVSV